MRPGFPAGQGVVVDLAQRERYDAVGGLPLGRHPSLRDELRGDQGDARGPVPHGFDVPGMVRAQPWPPFTPKVTGSLVHTYMLGELG